jgi:hypothetical protein
MNPTLAEIVHGAEVEKKEERVVPTRIIAQIGDRILYDMPWKSPYDDFFVPLVPRAPRQTMSRRPPPWKRQQVPPADVTP